MDYGIVRCEAVVFIIVVFVFVIIVMIDMPVIAVMMIVILEMYGAIPYIDTRRRPVMFSMEKAAQTPGKMEARKELRMHRADEERIRAAAAATGLQEADFIRQAALLRAQEVEQRMSLSILPVEAFEAFRAAVGAPGKVVPGLARAAEASKGLLKDAG